MLEGTDPDSDAFFDNQSRDTASFSAHSQHHLGRSPADGTYQPRRRLASIVHRNAPTIADDYFDVATNCLLS